MGTKRYLETAESSAATAAPEENGDTIVKSLTEYSNHSMRIKNTS